MGASFKAGDEVEVTGSKVKQGGTDLILAREVTKGERRAHPAIQGREAGVVRSSHPSAIPPFPKRRERMGHPQCGSLRRAEAAEHGFAEAAAERELGAVAQQDRVVAVERRLQAS